jgi:uncharacterized glyoxalase superfamily protein PhnB
MSTHKASPIWGLRRTHPDTEWNSGRALALSDAAHDHARAEELVQFIKRVFEAHGEYQSTRPTVLSIGDCMLMISDAPLREAMPAFLYVYVPDVDDTYQRAVQAGAESLEPPEDLPYGIAALW